MMQYSNVHIVPAFSVMTRVSSLFISALECLSTNQPLDPQHGLPGTPMEVFISDIPTVYGRAIRTDGCAETERLVFKWQLWRDTGSPPALTWELVNIQQPEADSLVLSEYILEPGLYRILLEVNVTGSVEQSSGTLFLSVSLPSIVAAVSGGVSLRQAVFGQAHVLDAEASSYDPAHDALARSPIGSGSLSYTWTCYKLDSEDLVPRYTAPFGRDTSYRLLPECTGIGALPGQGEITLDTARFSYEDLALVEVVVRSNIGSRNSTAVTVLKMDVWKRPLVSIK